MKYIIFVLLIFLASCANPFARDNREHETIQVVTLEEVKPIKQLYCSQITSELYESHRCDKITFKALQVAFCGGGSISGHEEGGKWYRWDLNDDIACYKDGQEWPETGKGSRSECSGDGYISVSHTWISNGDQPQASRTLQYVEDQDWVCGEGYTGYTKMGKLKWLLRTVRDHLEGKEKPTPIDAAAAMAASGIANLGVLLKEFNKYLVALHMYSFGRMNHALSDRTMDMLKDLLDSSPDSMIFQSLYHRYLDGDQQVALDIIKRECPADVLPTDVGFAGWGSSPRAIHCIVAISILEGL